MKRLGLAAAAGLVGMTTAAAAQEAWGPPAYGGFGGQYVQAPSLYYPFPGVVESRFGSYFSTPIIPPAVVETPVEAASIATTNAAHEGVDPAVAAKAEADAAAGGKRPAAAARNNRRGPQKTLRNAYRPPAPYRRALPRGDFRTLNDRAAGVPTYSPDARLRTYGQGYGMGPYGTDFYAGWWKGWNPTAGPLVGADHP